MKNSFDEGCVQFITHATERYGTLDSVRMALEGGCRWIQLRMKDSLLQDIERVALEVRTLCWEYNARFILDDHVGLVRKVGADGVHLGRHDMPVKEARMVLGEEFVIGGTANSFADIRKLAADGADYIGCGPFRFTTTKQNLSPLLGLEGYERIIGEMRRQDIHLPVVAIGGITAGDIPAILHTGVNGIAVSGSVLQAENPIEEMKNIIEITEKWKN